MVVGEGLTEFKKVYMQFLAQNRDSFCLPCVHAGMECTPNKTPELYIITKGSFMIGWILAWLFLVNERPYPQPNIEIRKPKKELKVTLISVTICSLIFFICTLESAGLRPWQNRFLVLVAHKMELRWKFLILTESSFLWSGNLATIILDHLHALESFWRAFWRERCTCL